MPAFSIVMVITWLLLRGARESTTANNVMVVIKLLALGLFIIVGVTHLNFANYTPFAPNGFTGIHQGAAIVFFAYIGFDAISTAAEETTNPQRNLPIGILGGLAVCTVIYVIVGAVLTGMVPYKTLANSADPLSYALQAAGFQRAGWIVALGAAVSMSAVLLVFQYGQPRIFFSMARDGLLPQWAAKIHPVSRIPYTTTLLTGVLVALGSLIGDAAETYDLTNIGTLFAFALVSHWCRRPAREGAGQTAPVQGAVCLGGFDPGHRGVPVRDGGAAAAGVGAIRNLAGDRAGRLRLLRLLTFTDQGTVGRSPSLAGDTRGAELQFCPSPHSLDAILAEDGVRRHDRQFIAERLRDQQAVERIAVMEGQPGHVSRMPQVDRQRLEFVGRQLL